jgi:beta-glucanase (GH16 family)
MAHVRRRRRPVRRTNKAAGAIIASAAALATAGALLVVGVGRTDEASGPLKTAPDGRRLSLTFSDEYNELSVKPGGRVWQTVFFDGKKTGVDQRTIKSNKELQLYVDPGFGDAAGPFGLNPFRVRSGVLEIVASPTPPALVPRMEGYRYVSGLISSAPSFSQQYGYFEIRAKPPAGKGLWPAFWMLPADHTWPPEIDVLESIGDPSKAFVTIHSKAVSPNTVEARIAPGAFHTFAVSWDPKLVVWYIDGKEVARQATPADLHKPMFLVANLAVGGQWPGEPDASTPLPATFGIDYIRAYKFAD